VAYFIITGKHIDANTGKTNFPLIFYIIIIPFE
jgi:hypothetical protein